MEYRIIERDEVGYEHGSGWGLRPTAYEVFIHYPGANPPPGPHATLEEDLEYARYLDDIGYGRFKDADLSAEGIDAWPGDPGAGISYSLLFCRSGRIIRGHDPDRQSSHTKGHNYQGMGYCVLIAEGDQANQAQLDGIVWAVHEQVRRGELAAPVITGGHRDVYPTICPTDKVYAQLPALKERVEGGTTMARRAPTRRDLNNLVANQKARGFEHYCTPYSHDAGICPLHGAPAGSKGPHSWDSRHRKAGAVDFGWPGAPISDLERIHVLLEMDRLANDPDIDWRMRFNVGDADHPDHGHVDDGEFLPGFDDDVRDRQRVMARDGVDLFVSPRAFPNHIPPTNRDGAFRLVDGVVAQKAMARLVDPSTGKPFYTGTIDGYLGSKSRLAAKAVQDYLGLEVDGRPGPGTVAAVEQALKTPAKPVGPDYSGFTTADIEAAQVELRTAGWYRDVVDGKPGPNFQAAMDMAQTELKADGLYGGELDLLPGPMFMEAIREHNRLEAQPAPPTLAQRVAPFRVAGPDAPSTAVAAAGTVWPAGKGLLLYRRNTPDEGAALQALRLCTLDTYALPVNADGSLPASIRAYAAKSGLRWVRAIGGSVSVSDRALSTALTAAGITH